MLAPSLPIQKVCDSRNGQKQFKSACREIAVKHANVDVRVTVRMTSSEANAEKRTLLAWQGISGGGGPSNGQEAEAAEAAEGAAQGSGEGAAQSSAKGAALSAEIGHEVRAECGLFMIKLGFPPAFRMASFTVSLTATSSLSMIPIILLPVFLKILICPLIITGSDERSSIFIFVFFIFFIFLYLPEDMG
ncbi:hypothetical protein CYMTET_25792 [Cymbomonas tetramitiformis]|uniref:Uncharacterized protein n=1 Tax=Cymbomonas tetramitiformis TaxID=36881 RepID=A0AAE0FTU0_9CHLO|nr:hypothetical protein CYMTET_25792 [Cymbomonas tetramitiformis]